MAEALRTCKKNKLTVTEKKRLAELLLKRLMKSKWIDEIVRMYQKVIEENANRGITDYALMIELNAKTPKDVDVVTPELLELIAQCCGGGYLDGLTVTKSYKAPLQNHDRPVRMKTRSHAKAQEKLRINSTVWRITNSVGAGNGTITLTISSVNERCRFEFSVHE